jgi:hypothetical protein
MDERLEEVEMKINLILIQIEAIEATLQVLLNRPEPYHVHYGPGRPQIKGRGEDNRPAEDCVE